MRGKRGQIFILAAIIIVLSIISVSIKYNTAREYPLLVDYEQISGNYLSEMPKIINYAKFINANPITLLDAFTKSYVETVHAKDPKFGAFYAYRDESGIVHITNTLNNRVLKIKVVDPATLEVKKDVLSYGSVRSTSNVCIAGIGCSTATTDSNRFGGEYSETRQISLRTTENEQDNQLIICMKNDNDGEDCTSPLPEVLTLLTNTEIDIPQDFVRTTELQSKQIEYILESN